MANFQAFSIYFVCQSSSNVFTFFPLFSCKIRQLFIFIVIYFFHVCWWYINACNTVSRSGKTLFSFKQIPFKLYSESIVFQTLTVYVDNIKLHYSQIFFDYSDSYWSLYRFTEWPFRSF